MRSIIFAAAFVAAGATSAVAQSCGGEYIVKAGDTLSQIADSLYKDARKWSSIYNANLAVIGKSPNRIQIGQRLRLSCINGLPTGLPGGVETASTPKPKQAPADTQAVEAKDEADPEALRIRMVTADDYAPFTDRNALNEGLVTEIVKEAMAEATNVEDHKIYWVNDWSSHLEPILSDGIMDVGFPWLQPDCKSNTESYRCANFHFSDPMFEMLVLLFADLRKPFVYEDDSDVIGKTLCRPKGYYTHDLDKDGRNWLANGLIKLKQPLSVADCFELLDKGEVDAVALNEFTGRKAIKDLGIGNWVEIVQSRPLSIEGLHVLVHKSHPKAMEMIDAVNDGLDQIKKNGSYQGVIDKHMSAIWGEL